MTDCLVCKAVSEDLNRQSAAGTETFIIVYEKLLPIVDCRGFRVSEFQTSTAVAVAQTKIVQ